MVTVLVIEDDTTILDNTLELLNLEGFTTIGAQDGVEGLQLAFEHLPDVIICDVRMPRLDGYGVLREIRNTHATSAIPFIFVSAAPREEILATSAKIGVAECLVKPFRANELLRIVQRLIGNKAIS